MPASPLRRHLDHPHGRGHSPADGHTGAAGGAACRDLVRLSVSVAGAEVRDAGFDARGCAATLAAGSAAAALVAGRPVLEAARLGADDIAAELGGLTPGARHAADLAADALHRALGGAAAHAAAIPPHPGRTLVAMSGGVDSAVAALLCSGGDAEAAAVTLELWADRDNDPERSCCSASAVRSARTLAHQLGLAHFTLDLRDRFRAGVIEPFVDEHRRGWTPNPCVRCNGHVRLDAMLDLAGRLGADALATGHYAAIEDDGEGPVLRRALDPAKDQSYMLAAVAPGSLSRLRFPLGALTKPQVRRLAARAGLPVADKRDSQDLCFLAGTDRTAFLARHGGERGHPGDVVDDQGTVLGRHPGHQAFTVGQRRGLGVAAPQPLYVLSTDADANRVVVGPRERLRRSRVTLAGATLHRHAGRVDRVKLRYRSHAVPCRIAGTPPPGRHRRLELVLDEPVEAAAPGQTACLMEGDRVLGHATVAPD